MAVLIQPERAHDRPLLTEDDDRNRTPVWQHRVDLTLPAKNVSLTGWFNSAKERRNDEESKVAIHVGIRFEAGEV